MWTQHSWRSLYLSLGWHHWLDGRESEWTPGDGDGQGGLACCDSCSLKFYMMYSAVQFNCSVVSDSLQPHGLQHPRPPCPSPTPRVHSDSGPSSQWCHPSSVSSCPQSFPASGSFQMSQFFTSSGQSFGVSALASFLPEKSQDWPPLERNGWISLQSLCHYCIGNLFPFKFCF